MKNKKKTPVRRQVPVYEGQYEAERTDAARLKRMQQAAADQMRGQGKYTYASGAVYEGQWEDGKPHGQGKYTKVGGEVYEGQWKAQKKHGQGKLTYASGDVYKGQWEAGKRHGQGKYTEWAVPFGGVWKSLEGQWQNDKQVGLHTGLKKDGSAFEKTF